MLQWNLHPMQVFFKTGGLLFLVVGLGRCQVMNEYVKILIGCNMDLVTPCLEVVCS